MVIKLLQEQSIPMSIMTSVTFDLMTPTFDKIIVTSIGIYEPSLKLIRQIVLKLLREQKRGGRIVYLYSINLTEFYFRAKGLHSL